MNFDNIDTSSASINVLPDDLLVEIVTACPTPTLRSIVCVGGRLSTAFYTICHDSSDIFCVSEHNVRFMKNLASLDLLCDRVFLRQKHLKLLTNLRSLMLNEDHYRASAFKGLTKIEAMYARGRTHIDPAAFDHLHGLTQLELLDLRRLKRFSLNGAVELKSLTITNTAITSDMISRLTNLEVLDMKNEPFKPQILITSSGISCLRNLTFLQLSGSFPCITDISLKELVRLESLYLEADRGCTDITDVGLQYLTGLVNLRIRGRHRRFITSECVKNMKKLNTLYLHTTNCIGDDAFKYIPQLGYLTLEHVTRVTFRCFEPLSNLVSLYMNDVGSVTNQALRYLQGIQELTLFNMGSIWHVGDLEHLNYVGLSNCQVGNLGSRMSYLEIGPGTQGVTQTMLQNCTSLEVLNIDNENHLYDACVYLPNLKKLTELTIQLNSFYVSNYLDRSVWHTLSDMVEANLRTLTDANIIVPCWDI